MSAAQKNLLVKHRVQLINSIIPNEDFYSYLRAGNHMTESMQQELVVCTQNIFMSFKQHCGQCLGLYFSLV